MNKQIAVLGCGWLGLPLATSLVEKGYQVKGSTTSEEKLVELERKGIRAYLISLSENGISGAVTDFLKDVQVLIINIPPKLRGAQSENYLQKMQLLHAEVIRASITQIIFVSSTSVYGTIEGEVTESTSPVPNTESGKQLLAAEAVFKNAQELHTTIVRFGGLIGSDRHPVRMLSGKKGLSNGSHCVNLIHRRDCIRIMELIISENWWNQLVNGVYPYHPSKKKYYSLIANQMRLHPPEYKEYDSFSGKKVVPKTLLNVKGFSFNTSIYS